MPADAAAVLLLIHRDGGSQCRCHVLVDITCSHDIDVAGVEFYLYPTVGTVLIHSVKPELTE